MSEDKKEINKFQKDISPSKIDISPIKVEHRLGELKRRTIEDSDEMVKVTMNTFGVTSADHANPILKTIGASFCVAVALYDPRTKTAGLVHIIEADRSKKGVSESISVRNDIKNMLKVMEGNGVRHDDRMGIQAHILGGLSDDDLAKLAREGLKVLGITQIEADERTDNDPSRLGFNIAIDAGTGEVFDLVNIKPTEINRYDELRGFARTPSGAFLTSDSRSLE